MHQIDLENYKNKWSEINKSNKNTKSRYVFEKELKLWNTKIKEIRTPELQAAIQNEIDLIQKELDEWEIEENRVGQEHQKLWEQFEDELMKICKFDKHPKYKNIKSYIYNEGHDSFENMIKVASNVYQVITKALGE